MMRQVEARFGEPLEDLLPRLYLALNQEEMAQHFGVDPATVNRWMRLFGVPTNRRKLRMADVHPADGSDETTLRLPPDGGAAYDTEVEAS
jgi:transcriptional regulator with XRE-family HTH domain